MNKHDAVTKMTAFSEQLTKVRLEIEKTESLFGAQLSDLLSNPETIDFSAVNLLIDKRHRYVTELVERVLNSQLPNDSDSKQVSHC